MRKQAVERGNTRLTVVFGTKGGRPRETAILDTTAVKKALDNALAIAENRNGRLVGLILKVQWTTGTTRRRVWV
ncbi:hypothetical protein IY40_12115 [Serratia marcescens]|nr:hypothetical protein IY40_12115 [Serratia marcescens]